jgi:putative regulator of septum formation
MPYQQPGYAQPYGQPDGPTRSRKGLYIALAIIGVVVVVAIAGVVSIALFARDNVVTAKTKVGDCIKDVPTDSLVLTLPTIDCNEPHGGEVYAVLTMPDGDYPGSATIDEWQYKCPGALASFAPDADKDPSVGTFVLYPTKETWDAGDRAVTCVATLNPKRAGSLRG